MTALIIPAYMPQNALLTLAQQIAKLAAFCLVVVDDGSGEAFASIFAELPAGTTFLRHAENRGKGAALKTAIAYVLENLPDCDVLLTADADGQHAYRDILRVEAAARENPEALVLGCRALRGRIPLRSRVGNALTRQVFAAVAGRKVSDTQTGLRAFRRRAAKRFLAIRGERYEYEINMLLTAAREGLPLKEVPIETIYIDDNASSHFRPLRDGLKIYGCILLFAGSSLTAFGIDFALVLTLKPALSLALPAGAALLVSVVAARAVSASVNFSINRRIFGGDERLRASAAKYALLALAVMALNYCMLYLLTLGFRWPLAPSKMLAEVALFVLSFFVQGRYVYRRAVRQ